MLNRRCGKIQAKFQLCKHSAVYYLKSEGEGQGEGNHRYFSAFKIGQLKAKSSEDMYFLMLDSRVTFSALYVVFRNYMRLGEKTGYKKLYNCTLDRNACESSTKAKRKPREVA